MGTVRAAWVGAWARLACAVFALSACAGDDTPEQSAGAGSESSLAAGSDGHAAGSGGTGAGSMAPSPDASDASHASASGGGAAASVGDSGDDADSGTELDAGCDGDACVAPVYEAPCEVSASSVLCEHTVTQLQYSRGTRNVYWTAPIGEAPAAGFPLAIIFQGSFFGPSFTWQALTPDMPFGGFYQGLLHVRLLEAGFVVVEPEAEGGIAWQTNGGGDYAASSDHALMQELLHRFCETDDFGPIDCGRLYATGISSGGYMTSRMAVSYPGVMRALAIQSGSYATCLGPLCTVPATLPSDHPPTLFLHGDADGTVPLATAVAYRDALQAQGTETQLRVDMGIGHAWLQRAPEEIAQWFLTH